MKPEKLSMANFARICKVLIKYMKRVDDGYGEARGQERLRKMSDSIK